MIEISIDQGNTWWELLSIGWQHGNTIFTGNLGRQGALKFDPTFIP